MENHVHGALLVLMELLNHPKKLEDSDTDTKLSQSMAKTLRESMNKNFRQFADCILDKKSSPLPLIKLAVIELIPILAKFDKSVDHSASRSTFMMSCVGPSVDFLIDSIKKDANVNSSYTSLGSLCYILGRALPKQMLDQIIEILFECFKSEGQEHHCESALQALGMVVRSLSGNSVKKLSNELVFLVPNLFKGGLTPSLIQTLEDICATVEEARGVIQSKLFSEVDIILRCHTNKHMDMISPSGSPTSPNQVRLRAQTASQRTHSQSLFTRPQDAFTAVTSVFTTNSKLDMNMDMFEEDENSIYVRYVVLALNTLQTFDFYTKHQQGAHQVLKTIRESVINCLDDEDKSIRKSATETCCKILDRSLNDKELLGAKRVSSR